MRISDWSSDVCSSDLNGPHVLIATAGGTPIAQTLTGPASGLAESSGVKVPVEDVVPLTADDPTGAGLTALALPLVFGGIMPAVVLVQLLDLKSTRLNSSH